MNSEYLRHNNENDLDYAMRLISIKKELRPDDLDWHDIVELLGLDYNPDSLRKAQDSPYGGLAVYKAMRERNSGEGDSAIKEELQSLRRIKVEVADERVALNKLIKEQTRIETLKEIAKVCQSKIEPLEVYPVTETKGDHSLVIALSDFHYGLEINEFNNVYNVDVFHKRLEFLLNECIKYFSESGKIKDFIVLGIGDFISGIIHNVIRLEARENVMQQIINVSKALAEFLNILSRYAHVSYFDCVGNHSRLFEDKNNCLAKESFDVLIHYILEQTFIGHNNIEIKNYTISERIGTFSLYGKNYAFVHGDGFSVETISKDLSAMTKIFYEAIFLGHIHHLYIEEQNGTLVIANGTLAGNDEFCNKLRKTSIPSQNIIEISENGIEVIKPIRFIEG